MDDQDSKNINDPTLADSVTEPVTDEVIPAAVEMKAVKDEPRSSNELEEKPEAPENSDDQKSSESDNQNNEKSASESIENSDSSKSSETSEPSETTDKPDTDEAVDAPKPAPKPEPTGPKAHWYVVHTYSGHEAKVAATLKQRIDSQKISDKILDILVPTQEKIEIKEGKKNTVKEKIFPGYILIRMVLDDISWLAVRTTPGITSFVGNANKPTPLSEAEVETIKRFMSMEAPKFKTAFAIGEAVKIIEGPFAEFLGSIAEIDEEKGKLKVMVSIFGRETPVELDFLQVNKL